MFRVSQGLWRTNSTASGRCSPWPRSASAGTGAGTSGTRPCPGERSSPTCAIRPPYLLPGARPSAEAVYCLWGTRKAANWGFIFGRGLELRVSIRAGE
ncbi:hypothetical protein V8C35DRAFT_299200 [Trichoderma chlorosporum]